MWAFRRHGIGPRDLLAVLAHPVGEFFFAHTARWQVHEHPVGIFLAGIDLDAVHVEKCEGDNQRRTLVPIREGMVFDDAECICSGEPRQRWLFLSVGQQISGPRQS